MANKVFLIGNLGKDPELKGDICIFSLCTKGFKPGDEEWHDIKVFEKQARSAFEYLKKGSQVCIEGRIKTEKWDDKTTGEKRSAKKIYADRVEFLGSKNKDAVAKPDLGWTKEDLQGDDDVPF